MKMNALIILALAITTLASCTKIPKTPEPIIANLEQRTSGDEIVVILGGDTMLDDLGLPFLLKYGYSYALEDLSKVFQSADIVVVNLETPVARECKRAAKLYSYFALPESLIAMKEAGINVLDLANNHTFDCQVKGFQETVENIEKLGLYHFGAGKGELSRRGLVINIKNKKIGFLGYWQYGNPVGEYQTAKPDKAILEKDVKRMKKYYCNLLFVVFHWGKNYHFDVYSSQKKLAIAALDAGADAVVGHHPHIIQPVEIYKSKPIIYSVGNMAFGTGNNRSEYGLLAKFTIAKSKIARTELIPLFVQNRNRNVLWKTRVLNNSRGKAVIDRISAESQKRKATLNWEGGAGVLLHTR